MTPFLDRRAFLRCGAAATSTVFLPNPLIANPYAPWATRSATGAPVRVRGIVRSRGRGLPNVPVSDGLSVVDTATDGTFELLTTSEHEFVFASVPSGFRIPTSGVGTATAYADIPRMGRDEMTMELDLERLAESDAEHTMLLLPDVQTEDREEMAWFHEQSVPDVSETVRSLGDKHVFGVACGDIMYDDLTMYPDYERGVQTIGVPFFQVVGNHDLDLAEGTDEASTRTFARHFGPRYRSFDRGAVHYVIMDDVFWHGAGYLGYLGRDQLTWLENDLQRVELGRPVVVALHIPALGTGHIRRGMEQPGTNVSVANRELLYRLLEPYNAHLVSGHIHENEHNFGNGVHEHVSGTVCGAWWSGPICADGTPSGYAVYDVRGEEITWRYKPTGKDASHQIRTYPHGADSSAPDEIVANVWDWDDQWTVEWFEDGERRGAMSRRVGRDPLSVELHTGPDLPPRRKWVEPYPTNHLFYAPASREAREIRVVATDRFGRSYSEVVESKS